MIDYTLNDLGDTIQISIPNQPNWGTICFGWQKSNSEFTTALDSKGLEAFVQLLIDNPNTAYTIFIS
jgi:hypothetical protein